MVKAKKSFGQNFLKDKNIINKIVSSIGFTEKDLVIEIGPGKGALTKVLKENNARVLAFEIDERMHEYLDKLEDDKINVVYEDILKINLTNVLSKYKYDKLYVIANLPYYITTPIIEKLIFLDINIDQMTVMVQNEVADRFCAKPGTSSYGMMTVLLNYKYDLSKLFVVSKYCFDPVPKVESAVVNFKIKDRNQYINVNVDNLKKVTSLAFSHKRKTLKNNLGNDNFAIIQSILLDHGFDNNVRAEQIPLNVYIEISNKLYN
ncbi:MAG: ribosomal RNA small subunit methyltransferase A [Bacilli bacterium]|nr:ribosomal RNA small subunit methyltransferase A [Bacilli bacterium]